MVKQFGEAVFENVALPWESSPGPISMRVDLVTTVPQGLDQLSLDGVEGTLEKRRKIVTYVMSNLHRSALNLVLVENFYFLSHNIYVYKFILCELLNLVNVFGQMWLMDVFFGGQFTFYGLEVR